MGFFQKISSGLKKTRDSVISQIQSMLHSFTKIDEDLFEELEELLIMGDVGMTTAEMICDELRSRVKEQGVTDPQAVTALLQDIVAEMLGGGETLDLESKPSVILVIGRNDIVVRFLNNKLHYISRTINSDASRSVLCIKNRYGNKRAVSRL